MNPNEIDQILPDYFLTAKHKLHRETKASFAKTTRMFLHYTRTIIWQSFTYAVPIETRYIFSSSNSVTLHVRGNKTSTSSVRIQDAVTKDDDFSYNMTKPFTLVHFHGTRRASEQGSFVRSLFLWEDVRGSDGSASVIGFVQLWAPLPLKVLRIIVPCVVASRS